MQVMNHSEATGCGSGAGTCGCGKRMGPADALAIGTIAQTPAAVDSMPIARVNGVPLHAAGEQIDTDSLRQRAYAELLRQEAVRKGLLAATDVASDDGVQSEAASKAVEQLLESELAVPAPDEATARRFFDANPARFQEGERVNARHILFAVTPGIDVVQLRKRAEAALLDARCRSDEAEDRFAGLAKSLSNCPSGESGGDLGWLSVADCAPEFSRELFGHAEVGVLPRIVHSRFGLHVVEVVARQAGAAPSFDAVRGAVLQVLQQQSYVTALRQYLQLVAGAAQIEGVDLDAADSPLVQ